MLQRLHLISQPLPMLYNDGAVLLGLVYGYLPFMVLPIYATLERLDPSLSEAAADLGARPLATVFRVIVPLARPGIVAGAVLVFIPCLGAYLTPDLLGGGRTVLVGNLVQNQFTTARDWPFGSAVSIVLMLLVTLLVWAFLRKQTRGRGMKRWLGVYAVAFFAFLHAPLLVLAAFSFNSSRFTVWEHFSLEWYRAIFRDPQIVEGTWNSVIIAALRHRRSRPCWARSAPTACGSAARGCSPGRCTFRWSRRRSSPGSRCWRCFSGHFGSCTGSWACTP